MKLIDEIAHISIVEWKAAGLTYNQYENDRKRDKLKATRATRNKPVQINLDSITDKTKKQKIITAFGDPYAKPEIKDAPLKYDDYSNKDIELAQHRRNIVVAYRMAAESANGSKVEAKKEFINLICLGLLLKKEFETIGNKLSFKTVERWDKQMRTGQNTMDDLLPKQREIIVDNELEKVHKDALISLYCGQNQLKVSECIRLAYKEWKIKGTAMVSESRCRRFLNAWAKENNATATFMRRGIKAMRDECLPYIDRDPDSIRFMDVLVADGHVLNFMIINPVTGKMCRPTLIAWTDMATRMTLGYEIMYTENTRSVLSAFRNACLNAAEMCGIEGGLLPRSVYMDNGKSFKNKFFTAKADLENDLGGLFERLKPFGLEHISFAKPYNARAKIIERVFRDFGEIERQLPSYCGTDIAHKPASSKRNEVWHRNQLQKCLNSHGKLTLQGSYSVIKTWIDEFHERESGSKYLKGNTPLQVAYNHIPELDVKSRMLADNHFDFMLMHTKVGRLQRNGFNIGGVWYYNVAEFANMAKDDTEYIVKYDVLKPGKVQVYHEDGSHWCSASQWIGQKAHAMAALGSEADRDHVANSNKALANIEKSVLKAAKSGEFINSNTIELPASSLQPVLVENTQDDDYIITEDGRRIKLEFFK